MRELRGGGGAAHLRLQEDPLQVTNSSPRYPSSSMQVFMGSARVYNCISLLHIAGLMFAHKTLESSDYCASSTYISVLYYDMFAKILHDCCYIIALLQL